MGWNDYGFPNPTFMLPYFPYLAMYLANKERYEIQSGNTYNQIAPAPLGTIAFNRYPFWPIYVSNYINQFIDISQHPTDILWSATDMVKAIEDRDIYDIGEVIPTSNDAYKLIMGADWPVKLAQQAYLNMNLLKLACIPKVQVIYGYGNAMYYPTPQQAYDAAVANLHIQVSGDVYISQVNNFNSTEMARSASGYNCYIGRLLEIKPSPNNYPGTENLPQSIYIYLWDVGSPDWRFDSHGLGIEFVPNTYMKMDLPFVAEGIAHPDILPEPESGFDVAYFMIQHTQKPAYCVSDISPLFEFYDNVDEIPTP
jgi:hypothetical protein